MKKQEGGFGISWEVLILLTITAVGLGFSTQRILHPSASPHKEWQPSADKPPSRNQEVMDLGCLDTPNRIPRRLASMAGIIRVQGRVCKTQEQKDLNLINEIKVKNITNGYEGTVFLQGGVDNQFTTDYLVLDNGKNLIEVQWASGEKIQAEVFQP